MSQDARVKPGARVSSTSRRGRFYVLLLLLGLAAFYAGRLVVTTPVAIHPLTGRPIAGLATSASWLDRAQREQEEAPDTALALIGIQPGMVVADVGAGSGYMTIRLAKLVGPGGHVYASDIQPGMIHMIREKVRIEHLTNVEVVQGTAIDASLPENAIDLALMVDVYHELQHPQELLRGLRRSLKPGAELVLVEYRKEDPSLPIAATHRMSVADARAELEGEGFTFVRSIPGLPRQHILVFRR